jgi:signal transduction histidine kinase
MGYTRLLEMGLHGPVTDAQREALHRIDANQARLLSLVTQILDYARLESGQLRLDVREVAASALFDGIEDAVTPQMRAKGLRFECCRECDGELVRADRQRAQQILLNLVSNAIKFTAPGGTISVSCERANDGVAIHVRDTGCGIAADRLESVFEPFVQVEQELTRTAEGAGLGLAISRDLAKAIGGDLTVESTLGHGSTFTLWLRLARHGARSRLAEGLGSRVQGPGPGLSATARGTRGGPLPSAAPAESREL